MDSGRREFLKNVGKAAWVVPAIQVVNMSAAAAGTTGSVTVPSPPPSTTQAPECGNRQSGWTKALWIGDAWVWSRSYVDNDCLDASDSIKTNGGALGAVITGDRRELVVVMSDKADIVATAYKTTSSDACSRGTLSPGFKLAAFQPPSGELTQIELLLDLCG